MFGANFSGNSGGSGGGGVSPVSPSVVNNFVAFSDLVGGQKDSGVSAATFLVIHPISNYRNLIQASIGLDIVPLAVKGVAGQSENLLEIQDVAGSVIAYIAPDGRGTFSGGIASIGTSNVVQLSVTPNGTQTNPTVKWFTSTGGKDFQFSKTGGITQNAVSDSGSGEYVYTSTRTYTGTNPINLLIGAVNDTIFYNPSGTAVSAKVAGIGGTVQKLGNSDTGATNGYLAGLYGASGIAGTVTAGSVFRVVGVIGTTAMDNASGGTTTHVIGMLSSIGGASGATVTNAYGVVIATTTTLGVTTMATTPDNMYGLYIEDIVNGTSNNYAIWANEGDVRFAGNLIMANGGGISVDIATLSFTTCTIQTDTTSGLQIGGAANQKISLWGVPTIVQPSGAAQAALASYATGAFGLDSNAHMQALYDLVMAMRTALVNSGIMKGAA